MEARRRGSVRVVCRRRRPSRRQRTTSRLGRPRRSQEARHGTSARFCRTSWTRRSPRAVGKARKLARCCSTRVGWRRGRGCSGSTSPPLAFCRTADVHTRFHDPPAPFLRLQASFDATYERARRADASRMAVGMAVTGATGLPWCNCTSFLPPPPLFLPRSPRSAPLPPGVQLMRSGSTNERPSGWIAFRSGFTRDVFGFASDRTRGRSGSTWDLKGKDLPGNPGERRPERSWSSASTTLAAPNVASWSKKTT